MKAISSTNRVLNALWLRRRRRRRQVRKLTNLLIGFDLNFSVIENKKRLVLLLANNFSQPNDWYCRDLYLFVVETKEEEEEEEEAVGCRRKRGAHLTANNNNNVSSFPCFPEFDCQYPSSQFSVLSSLWFLEFNLEAKDNKSIAICLFNSFFMSLVCLF